MFYFIALLCLAWGGFFIKTKYLAPLIGGAIYFIFADFVSEHYQWSEVYDIKIAQMDFIAACLFVVLRAHWTTPALFIISVLVYLLSEYTNIQFLQTSMDYIAVALSVGILASLLAPPVFAMYKQSPKPS